MSNFVDLIFKPLTKHVKRILIIEFLLILIILIIEFLKKHANEISQMA